MGQSSSNTTNVPQTPFVVADKKSPVQVLSAAADSEVPLFGWITDVFKALYERNGKKYPIYFINNVVYLQYLDEKRFYCCICIETDKNAADDQNINYRIYVSLIDKNLPVSQTPQKISLSALGESEVSSPFIPDVVSICERLFHSLLSNKAMGVITELINNTSATVYEPRSYVKPLVETDDSAVGELMEQDNDK